MRLVAFAFVAWAGCTTANTNNLTNRDLSGENSGDDLAGVDLRSLAPDLSVRPLADLSVNPTDQDLSVDPNSDMAVVSPSPTPSPTPSPSPSCMAATQGPLTTFYMPGTTSFTTNSAVAVELTVPDGYRVHGTVTLDGSYPPNFAFEAGVVLLTDKLAKRRYTAPTISKSDPSSFLYELIVPAGDYDVSVALAISNSTTFQEMDIRGISTVSVCGDTTKDLLLDSLPPLLDKQLKVTGFNALTDPSPGNAALVLETADARVAFAEGGDSFADAGDSLVINSMLVPSGATLKASVRLIKGTTHGGVAAGTLDIDDVVRVGADLFIPTDSSQPGNVVLPAVNKIQGTVADPVNQLFPVASGVAPHNVRCDHDRDGRFRQTASGTLFTDALPYKLYVQNNVECRFYGGFVVGMPSPGMPQTLERENTYGFYFTPGAPANETIIADQLARDFTIPNLGTQIKDAIHVKTAAGVNLQNYKVSLISSTLVDANLNGSILEVDVKSDAVGSADAHLLPGTYTLIFDK